MKADIKFVREQPCQKCGSQVFYTSAQRCVDCTNEKALKRTRELRQLREENAKLRGLIEEVFPAVDPALAGHNSVLGLRFDCSCVRCRVELQLVRWKV